MIAAEGIISGYGALKVLKDVTVEARAGQLAALVGANGAGKSTLLRCVQGLIPVWGGRVIFDGNDVTGWPAEKLVSAGLALVPETRELFPRLSVADNLMLGAYAFRHEKHASKKRVDALRKVYGLFPVLEERKNAPAGALSGGQQQMLAIGRALMCRPRALMLDEPSLGLAPLIVRQIFKVIRELSESGLAVLLVEQNIRAALQLAQQAYVLETGTVALAGPAERLLNDPSVKRAYLGGHVRSH
jgi:branched-chain amino acid transport system ATP-binding protein